MENRMKELLGDHKPDKYFELLTEIQGTQREYSAGKMKAEVAADKLFALYPEIDSKEILKKNQEYLKRETDQVILDIASLGPSKEIKVQEYFLKIIEEKQKEKDLGLILIKILEKILDLQGSEAVEGKDENSINIRSFVVRLSDVIKPIRGNALKQLFSIAETFKQDLFFVKQVIKVYAQAIRELEYRSRSIDGDKKEATDEIKLILGYLKHIKDQYSVEEIDHLDLYHEISLAFWDPYEEGFILRDIPEAKALKEEIWTDKYKLFKAIMRPGFKFSDQVPGIAQKFQAENLGLLEKIIEFGESEKSIYNSIKTFFRYLSPEVFKQAIDRAHNEDKSPLWYYLGFGFTKARDAFEFAKQYEKEKDLLKIKAGIDAFYHVGYMGEEKNDWADQNLADKKKTFKLLSILIKNGSENLKNNPSLAFWWSNSTANTAKVLFEKNLAKESFGLFNEILADSTEKDEFSNYLFNAVADSVFFTREDIRIQDRPYLKELLDKFVNAGEMNLQIEELLNVVASIDPLLVIDFYDQRLRIKDEKSTAKKFREFIPYSHDFVFEKMPTDQATIDKTFSAIAELNQKRHRDLVERASSIFISVLKKVGKEKAFDWLEKKYLGKDSSNEKFANALQLLREYNDYSDDPSDRYWSFLSMVVQEDKQLWKSVWLTIIMGSFDREIIAKKKKVFLEWSRDKNKNLQEFGKRQLLEVEKEEKEWLS